MKSLHSGRIISLTGFTILVITTFTLFLSNFAEALNYDYFVIFTIINLAALAGLAYETKLEFRSIILEKFPFRFRRSDAENFAAVLAGAVAAFHISAALNLGPVAAAGVTGLTASVILPRHDVPAYCGAFVGMSCPVAFGCYPCLLAAGLIAGAVFVISKNTLNGFGGKLGTIAFFGAVSALFLMGNAGKPGVIPALDVKIYIVAYSILAATITFLVSIRLGKGPVFASSFVGLLGGLLLPQIYPQFGEILGVIVICASFAGMSSPERITTNMQMIGAGILSGIFFIYTLTHFPGAGGKLGTIAFMSCITVRGWADIYRKARSGLRKPHPQKDSTGRGSYR